MKNIIKIERLNIAQLLCHLADVNMDKEVVEAVLYEMACRRSRLCDDDGDSVDEMETVRLTRVMRDLKAGSLWDAVDHVPSGMSGEKRMLAALCRYQKRNISKQ